MTGGIPSGVDFAGIPQADDIRDRCILEALP